MPYDFTTVGQSISVPLPDAQALSGIGYDQTTGALTINTPGLYWVSYRITLDSPTQMVKASVNFDGTELAESVTNGDTGQSPPVRLMMLEKQFEHYFPNAGSLLLTMAGLETGNGTLASGAGAALAIVLLLPDNAFPNPVTGKLEPRPDTSPTIFA
jgi:hypothetical protein